MQKINVSYTMVFADEIFAKLLEESGLSNASEMVGFLKATIRGDRLSSILNNARLI